MEIDSEEITQEDADGSICNIHVRNFFCHDNLQIDLNKNVNFVVGRNGSGKSAILTALVVGLGGRASATNRGSNLHSFIKKGANSATVEIKIKNSSGLAYKRHIYGDYISIVRQINASGGSSYKIKNASGEVVSTKFDEVRNIITAHDIQVDNPISVLNQDDARSFHASDAKKKFMLFRKATNMDLTETNYETTLADCKRSIGITTRKRETLEVLEKEYKKLKATHARLQSHSEIEAQEKALENEYYWSEIVQYEREAELIQAQYNKQKGKIDKLVAKLNELEQNYGSNNGSIEGLKEQLDQHTLQRTALEQEYRELEGQVRQAQTALRGLQNTNAKHKELLKRESRKVVDLEREIQSIDAGDAASQRASLEAAAAVATAAADAARARYDTAQHEAAQARQHAAHCATEQDRAAVPPQRARQRLKELKKELRELESRGDDSLAVYGANMVALCHAVKQAAQRGQFSAPPRGPVGAHLKVREKRWGGALEHVLGGNMQAFCVNTDKDLRTLFEIMGKIYGKAQKPSVTCSQFLPRQHNVEGKRVRVGSYLSALDSLAVDDPVVANFLIDNVGVEKILMVPDHAEAQRLSDRIENVPENCSKIVTLDTTEYHPAPSYRSYGGVARPSRFLHVSSGEKKRQILAEIKEVETQLKALEAEEEQRGREVKQAKEAERAASRALQALMGDRHSKEEAERVAISALQTQQQPHHAVLEEELNVSKEKLASLTKQVEELKQKEQAQRQKIEEFEEKMRDTKSELGLLHTACRNLDEEIEKEQLKAEQGVTERLTYKQRVKEERAKLAHVAATLDERRTVISSKIADAEMLCPRVDNPRDKEMVKREIEQAKSKLNSIRNEGRSKAEVEEELLRVEPQYRNTKAELERHKEMVELIKQSTEAHRNIALQDQRGTANLVQHHFNAMLNVNQYSGSMKIDFGKGVLEILCTGRESKRLASTTASLSGGERSYSTVAFIMALWACVEVPFYFLDEFDVFMDNVNRRKVMNALLHHALNHPTRQFVFLTPQDASSVTAGPQVSIHVMPDPRP